MPNERRKQPTEADIRATIEEEFAVWDRIMREGCNDPTWPDGVNLNLVRNHILYEYRMLKDAMEAEAQLSMFDAGVDLTGMRPVPPEVPDGYMVRNGKYADIRIPRFQARGRPLVFELNQAM